jgi:hypothetical protein
MPADLPDLRRNTLAYCALREPAAPTDQGR